MNQATTDRIARTVYAIIFGGGVLVGTAVVIAGVVGAVVFDKMSARLWMVLPVGSGALLALGSLDYLTYILHHNDLPN